MGKNQERPKDIETPSFGTMLNWLWLGDGGLCMVLYPLTRWRVGKRGWGWIGLAGIAVMYFWCGFRPCPEVAPFFIFVWFPMLLLNRLVTLFGGKQIGKYEGDCWARVFLPFVGEQTAKLVLEPALAYGIAQAVATVSVGLGELFTLSAGAMFFRQAVMMLIRKNQDDTEADGRIEMAQRAERMRKRGW